MLLEQDASMTMKIKVPATTANLGSGFDCVGFALDLWNEIEIVYGERGLQVLGYGSETLNNPADNLMYTSFERLINESGQSIPDVKLISTNKIPLARGLGSSAAAVVGGLFAANVLIGEPLTSSELLDLATKIEGHPDNVAPALLGGCVISILDDDVVHYSPVDFSIEIKGVLFVPDQILPTSVARSVLPTMVPFNDAVFNLGRVALLINAFSTGDFSKLNIATKDRLHQPYREVLFPSMSRIMKAAMDGGAAGAFLSGAGPTIIALTESNEMTIGFEMSEIALKSGVPGDIFVYSFTKAGAHLSSEVAS